MAKIRIMSDALASQVAAGEVVERPASVVKELLENSIDAGARSIEVRAERGGLALIRVSDDGSGMARDDALLCVERHATSKIRTKEDLASICTLGFRGEALPSIASVAKFRLRTREPDALGGTEITIHGGKMVSVADAGGPPGTEIEVRSLFYNLPARRKFVRSESTEYGHLEQVIRLQAVAHPEIRFAFVHGDRVVFHLPATHDRLERIRGLAGADLAGRLLEVTRREEQAVTVSGYIGPPGMGRSDRRYLNVFLNGRPVEAPVLTYGVREGYHTALMKGQYPVTFLFLELDPGAVDVNVHPAKREVRFHNAGAVREAVIEAVADTLRRQMARPVSGVGMSGLSSRMAPDAPEKAIDDDIAPPGTTRAQELAPALPPPSPVEHQPEWFQDVERPAPVPRLIPEGTAAPGLPVEASSPEEISPLPESSSPVRPKPEDFRYLGVLGKLYVLLESREGLVLMDQHAAHERVLFEEMRRRMETEGVPSQRLLVPLTVELEPRDLEMLSRHTDALQRLGVGAEPFGGNTLKIDSLPAFLKCADPMNFLHAVIEELRSTSRRMSTLRLGEDLVATTVCRHAVKANDPLHEKELERLVRDLLACDMPYCCPHGRPTLIQMPYSDLERKFGRRS